MDNLFFIFLFFLVKARDLHFFFFVMKLFFSFIIHNEEKFIDSQFWNVGNLDEGACI
jgi:hypothetical protein